MAKYKVESYYNEDNELAKEVGAPAGLDQTLFYEKLEDAETAAFFSIDLDFHDVVIITDMKTGKVVVQVGEFCAVA